MSISEALEIIDAIPIPAFAILSDARITAANEEAISLLGSQILNRHYVTALRQPGILAAIDNSFRTKNRASGTYTITSESGDERYKVVVTPLGTGSVAGTLVCFENISHLHAAGLMRRDFVANVSHELRTPLTAVIGFIETLRGPARNDPEAQDRFLEVMLKESQRMNRLVDDLLSLSRVEAAERQRPSDPVSIREIVEASASSLAKQVQEAKVEITFDIPDSDIELQGDRDQLRQVTNNLLENALKYGAQGGLIRIKVHEAEHDALLRAKAVRIDVMDSGPGIDPTHLPRLTERFYRIDEHRSREMGGTGLGLAIVKHIVSRHRGRIEIDSTKGKGSRFSIIIPAL
jgi:two-component system, OmpR family, phosphate regulon sensor histidine kinase PhoR